MPERAPDAAPAHTMHGTPARGSGDLRPLRATYRLQMGASLRLDDVRALVPYLARLGISHVYSSPLLAARPGSTHGYDVADPARLDPALGDDAAWRATIAALREHDMGWVLDIVPNHMFAGSANPYWDDVLARGRRSRWASWFDIEWGAYGGRSPGRLLLPVLGRSLEAALAAGELRLVVEHGRLRVRYFDASFPLDPDTVPPHLGVPADAPEARLRAAVAEHMEGAVGAVHLRALLDEQHYALAYWRRAAPALNYRRFFDVNELVALRMGDSAVFAEWHRLVLAWVRGGMLDGLRVDHVDGLADPRGYLERLRGAVEEARAGQHPAADGGGAADTFPIVVEKILAPDERLRPQWPVQGTTGYEFLDQLERVFVAPAGRDAIEQRYRRVVHLRDDRVDSAEVSVRAKVQVLRGALRPDVRRLARLLAPVARADARTTALERGAVAEALVLLLAALPVYRTYVDDRADTPTPEDRRVLATAVAAARARGAHPAALALLEDVLTKGVEDTAHGWEALSARERARRLRIITRFQQTSGPAAAKGVEDTALYRYVPLASLNEVGADPGHPLGDAVAELHAANAERARRWPRALLATSTHDTKRSADVRARLDVLSELPEEWNRTVARWRRLARGHRTRLGGRFAPDANTEYLLFQTLVGIWPAGAEADTREGATSEGATSGSAAAPGAAPSPAPDVAAVTATTLASLRERATAYMRKAAREAKAQTSWTDPDASWEEALARYIDGLLAAPDAPFVHALGAVVARVARPGFWTALARTLVHCTAPGVPDLYQGDELWNFSLVDPDNRRPVDFARRARLLAELEARFAPDDATRAILLRELVAHPEDGRIKLHVVHRALAARRAHPELFAGSYQSVAARGPRAAHVLAYLRRAAPGAAGGGAALIVVPRLTLALGDGRAPLGPDVWANTALPLPPELAGAQWRCALVGAERRVERADDLPALPLGTLFGDLPAALLLAPEA